MNYHFSIQTLKNFNTLVCFFLFLYIFLACVFLSALGSPEMGAWKSPILILLLLFCGLYQLEDTGFSLEHTSKLLVKIANSRSSSLVPGAPQGCTLSPFLYSLHTCDYVSRHPSIPVINFADDTSVEGLIENSDKNAYRDQLNHLASWCSGPGCSAWVKTASQGAARV